MGREGLEPPAYLTSLLYRQLASPFAYLPMERTEGVEPSPSGRRPDILPLNHVLSSGRRESNSRFLVGSQMHYRYATPAYGRGRRNRTFIGRLSTACSTIELCHITPAAGVEPALVALTGRRSSS